ncbi:unnamed protein product [Trichogramma brassicae]|uniref:Uncharacterized protein n=1 Tax=Trichogramma brassicae TaxID=86971 RepID=A0A6H5ISF1_9HYME|nr:unnamed protein product [Trichogramma brassicae]
MSEKKSIESCVLLQSTTYPLNASCTKVGTVGLEFRNGEYKPAVQVSNAQNLYKGIVLDCEAANNAAVGPTRPYVQQNVSANNTIAAAAAVLPSAVPNYCNVAGCTLHHPAPTAFTPYRRLAAIQPKPSTSNIQASSLRPIASQGVNAVNRDEPRSVPPLRLRRVDVDAASPPPRPARGIAQQDSAEVSGVRGNEPRRVPALRLRRIIVPTRAARQEEESVQIKEVSTDQPTRDPQLPVWSVVQEPSVAIPRTLGEQGLGESTPAIIPQATRPRLSSIPENPSIQLNFSRPPLDNTLSGQIIPISIPNLNPIYNENTIDYAQENCSNTKQNRVTLSREGLTYIMKGTLRYIHIEEKDIVLGVKERTQRVDEILKSHKFLKIEYKKQEEGETIRVRLETSNESALLALDLLKESGWIPEEKSPSESETDPASEGESEDSPKSPELESDVEVIETETPGIIEISDEEGPVEEIDKNKFRLTFPRYISLAEVRKKLISMGTVADYKLNGIEETGALRATVKYEYAYQATRAKEELSRAGFKIHDITKPAPFNPHKREREE